MPDARPFRGWRYADGRALGARLCPPYDVIPPAVAAALRRRSRNAVALELPAGEGAAKYRGAARLWRAWRRDGTLARDAAPAYYLVEERFRRDGRSYVRRGLLAGLGVTDAAARRVIPHERTLSKPKADRLRLIGALKANVSPIFGVVADPRGELCAALARLASRAPDARAEAAGISYRVWVVAEPTAVARLRRLMLPRETLIADGHHRFAVSQAHWRRSRSSESEAVLCYLVPDSDAGLVVLPTHRISAERLGERAGGLAKLTPQKDLARLLKALDSSRNPYAFGLYEGKRGLLGEPRGRDGCRSGLSVEWIGRRLLEDLAPDQLGYTPDAAEAARRAAAQGGAAVLVKPFPVTQVRKAAKAVGLLPQKSTYFYPKVPTGLVFRDLTS
ncbi:MAG: DUF1015 domain-containing protein [Elusimicrobia bacterium]|nr:DUF1015 domain-containing protein [Elusimicrobiota bacterium]